MGAPMEHPFFGNQYTNGGYETGTFKYAQEFANQLTERLPLVKETIRNSSRKIVSVSRKQNEILKQNTPRMLNRKVLVVGGVSLAFVFGGYLVYKHFSKKAKAKLRYSHSVELSGVGVCQKCGESLHGSSYVPASDLNNQKAYIICKNCNEKNYAWYPKDNIQTNKDQ